MGFSDIWIDRIWRLLSNNWYSINLNDGRHGFFKSSRGLKQGDPFSPSLFVICAELLSRLLTILPNDGFIPYSAHKKDLWLPIFVMSMIPFFFLLETNHLLIWWWTGSTCTKKYLVSLLIKINLVFFYRLIFLLIIFMMWRMSRGSLN